MGIAGDLALILLAAFAGGLVAQCLRLPLVLGYILAGILVGPHTRGPTVSDSHQIELLADLGVGLLLYTVGLEFSMARLRPVLAITVLGTPLQIFLTIGLGLGVGHLLGLAFVQSLWLGCLLSLSSTMVTLKLLTDQGFSKALSGQVMLGMLVAQDLASIPMVIALPSLGQADTGSGLLVWTLMKTGLMVIVMLTFGARVLPRLLGLVLKLGSHELFLVTDIAVGVGIGYISHLCGLSFPLGAFMAGLVLSESDYSHHAMGTVGPFRDLFGMIFFVSVGMLVEPTYLWAHWPLVLGLLLLVTLGKAGILFGTSLAFGYRNVVPLAVALGISQVGEFSFVLARVGVQSGGLDRELYNLVLILAVLSMALTPLWVGLTRPLYAFWRQRRPLAVESMGEAVSEVGHVVIAGYGRVGRQAARALSELGHPCVACDLSFACFDQAKADGIPALLGDFTSPGVLHALGVERARQVILTIPDASVVNLAIEQLRHIDPTMEIVALAVSVRHLEELKQLGVSQIVLASFEAAIELTRQAIKPFGEAPHDVLESLRVRAYGREG